jgi:cell division protein FtsI (penicillin-binding protein 3)/stage V sporulation protein D (sporulation-specific penicillin-binding protein)
MASGIDAGKITPETTYVDKGSVTINGRKIENWDLKTHGAHGRVTMTGVIENSINTGAIFAQQQTGNETFKEYFLRFGFGEKTAVDMPGELSGDIKLLFRRDAPAVAFATASFGQGVAATPLQIVNAFSAIANKGVLMRPYVNAALAPKEVRRVVSEDTAKKVAKMMVSAVDKAEVAKVSGYSIAGKTGTAFIPDFKNGGYTDFVINTYVGFGPTSDPRFVILIKLTKPEGIPLAGTTVVPAFRELAQFLLNYYQVPPDRIEVRN